MEYNGLIVTVHIVQARLFDLFVMTSFAIGI